MTGSLQIKNGKYYAVINTHVNGKRKQKWIDSGLSVKGNKTKADKFLREQIAIYEAKEGLVSSDILLCDYIRIWLKSRMGKIDIATYEGYEMLVECDFYPYFSDKGTRLTDVDLRIIQEYFDFKATSGRKKDKSGLSPSTLKKHRNIIRQVLKQAVKEGYLHNNPCDFVELPKQKKFEPNFLTQEEASKLLEVIKDEKIYPMILIAIVYGMRRSEICGLQWNSINFEENTITVKHTMVKQKTLIIKDSTKTSSSYRTYPLLDIVKNELINIKEKQEENKRIFKKGYIQSPQVFTWDNGELITVDYLSHKFVKLLESNGLPKIRLHDLRHSCASILLSQGAQLKDVQEWLGHADISMTANVYGHLDIRRKQKLASEMASILTHTK